jgi:hypothetical protein
MTTVFKITAFDLTLYCKVNAIKIRDDNYFSFSFGGANKFCIFITISPEKANIDRIEYDKACVKDGTLEESGGTVKLVHAALWTIKEIFHTIDHLTFFDNSQIYCKENSHIYKLSLAYDYILKTGETWYENKFAAKLPDKYMIEYKNSLKILDKPLQPFELIKDQLLNIEEFKNHYDLAKSPRDFIKRLREEYKRDYCFKVGPWLSQFMTFLQIKIFSEEWFISLDTIKKPDNYSIKKTSDIIRGGYRCKGRSKKTRKFNNFCLISDLGEYPSIGDADSFTL